MYWCNLVGKPRREGELWYTPSSPKELVKVPTHLLLLAGFDGPLAREPKGALQKGAMKKDAFVISAVVRDDIEQELAVRALYEE